MLRRAGMVERAYEFIKRMAFHPTVSMWGSLLGACKVHRNNKLGKIDADKLFQLDPQDSGNHIILSNMFAAAGRWEEANVNSVHMFQAKDTGHERNTEIQAMLRKLKMEMKGAGYVAATSLALFDLEEEEERESEVVTGVQIGFDDLSLHKFVDVKFGSMVTGSVTVNLEEDEIIEICKAYE
ncbi:hypothetical protein L1987_43963 [Smallanthus sonchifolius]|uniref:Uncharacterized protein n=1 Tax=Smallanthus sonchifolius TaxID=185202 RepID=A0ACB9GPB9_9ASTR|nr:hypothetical protein L1987_43963 [Smallanthus sonchifolius]